MIDDNFERGECCEQCDNIPQTRTFLLRFTRTSNAAASSFPQLMSGMDSKNKFMCVDSCVSNRLPSVDVLQCN